MIYAKYLASHRFSKKIILVCDLDQVQELVSGLENVDTHYKIIGFVNTDLKNDTTIGLGITNILIDELESFVIKNSVSEVVIASQKTDGITVNLYNQLINLLENGFVIREYTQVYENLTQRIPVQYVARDFYRFFPFSRNNQNKLYLLFAKMFEIIVSIIGLSIGVMLLPFIIIMNFFANKGNLFFPVYCV